ncbi:unnamed protein product [Effrenium voratum]|nr:unnamed protein product [Effrenium voratum]
MSTRTCQQDGFPQAQPANATAQEKGAPPGKISQLPFAELEPFGRESTGQELTESSITETNAMVDQLEKAEVAEEKRSVFRALTRLRGVALSSFDGVAQAQSANIQDYTQQNHWRDSHPLHHLASEESDVSKWAFPANAD